MTQIFLIRHGEAEGNVYRRAQGQNDTNLTPRGRRQAEAQAARFAETELSAAYSSDLRRARETARAALGGRQLPVRKEPRLREMCFGIWENRPWGEINREEIETKNAFLFTMMKTSRMKTTAKTAPAENRLRSILFSLTGCSRGS